MRLFRLLMQILARADFENHREPRFNNEFYTNEYSNLYAIAESQAHSTLDYYL